MNHVVLHFSFIVKSLFIGTIIFISFFTIPICVAFVFPSVSESFVAFLSMFLALCFSISFAFINKKSPDQFMNTLSLGIKTTKM